MWRARPSWWWPTAIKGQERLLAQCHRGGVRTDSGYRFGSFHAGAFIEPLAIIAVNWAEIDGFTLGGSR